MTSLRRSTDVVAASDRWRDMDLRALLSQSAITLGAGTPTDAGTSSSPPTAASAPIALWAGLPDPATMPVRKLQEALTHVLRSAPEAALEYGGVLGLDGLRESLAERGSRRDGMPLSSRNFIMTAGSAGGLDNVCDAFLEPGDVVMVESPSFFGSVRTLRGHMAEVVPVTMDEEGVLVGELAEHIRMAEAAGKRVKLLYTVADFHNPTGTTMSPGRRHALIELCSERQVLIVEDAAYADIYFEAEPPLSLYGLAEGQGVVKVGTFSKPIATGLRVGWVQAREDIIDALSRVRFDMGISPLLLMALAEYVGSGSLEQHLEEMRPLYAAKCDALCASLQQHCSDYVRFTRPRGGFFLWVDCMEPLAPEVTGLAAELGLIFPAGANFFLRGDEDDRSHIRLAFSTATLDELDQVGPRLREAVRRMLEAG